MQNYLFRNIHIVNEGEIIAGDVYIREGRIERIGSSLNIKSNYSEIDGTGKHLLPGVIDDQVHFREPGLTHKASIYSESRAAVAGGITSFMEMPNTLPNTLTQDLLEEKYAIASRSSLANYSFYMGVSNDNVEEVLKTNRKKNDVCGIKIFMGSSTGNMLVNNHSTLNRIFADSEMLIATHCEDERIIRANYEKLKAAKPELSPADHPLIRNEEACYESSLLAIQFAMRHQSRLHILHISTEKELQLFSNMLPLKEKRITSEVCVHHLHFSSDDYDSLGYKIKCNPAIKHPKNKTALWQALNDDILDVIATDHAPHLPEEKEPPYEHAHAGLPLVQHSLILMLDHVQKGHLSLETLVRKMSHAVAECFMIKDRGYIREGYHADLVVVNMNNSTEIKKENLLYKCGWSPLEGFIAGARIEKTLVNGALVYENDRLIESQLGQHLTFNR